MNAYLNQVIQQFQHGRLGTFLPVQPHEYWDRLIEFPAQEDEEIRYLHEEYETVLRECCYCERVIEAGPDWGDYCEECYWALSDEGRD